MGEHIERLAQFVAQTQWEDIPAPVQRHTKLVLLDTLGVILAGGERPEVRQLRERLAGTAGTGERGALTDAVRRLLGRLRTSSRKNAKRSVIPGLGRSLRTRNLCTRARRHCGWAGVHRFRAWPSGAIPE